ncbi:MAG: BrnT family toxin [Deltaproteobacteria bacterium]
MDGIRFEWDVAKAAANASKHGVSFEEAATVFEDEHARLRNDPDHSDDEDRFILLGTSKRLRILVVAHCYRESDEVIRIISARRATTREAKQYEELW